MVGAAERRCRSRAIEWHLARACRTADRHPGVVAVTRGGSLAADLGHPAGDRGFWLYYRGDLRADEVRALGFEGTVVEPGEWGRLANGGARLTVEGQRVDLFYHDLDAVRH
jgi:hypothetical protein